MAQKKATQQKADPKGSQTESRYYLVRTLRTAGNDVADAARDYNRRYIQENVTSGRDFLKDLGDKPLKTLESLVEDGRETYTDLRKKARKEVDARLKTGRKFYRKAKKNPGNVPGDVVRETRALFDDLEAQARERVDDLVEGGRKVLEGLEEDSRLVVKDLKKVREIDLPKLPDSKTIARKIDQGLKTIPERLNLPSRSDIQKINTSMNALNRKVVRLGAN